MPGSLLFFLVLKQSVMKMRLVAAVCALIVAHFFGCFSCARQSVGWWKREFLNRPLDTAIVHFFLGVQRSDSNCHFEVSRGRIRISTLRCPEVGLGIPDLTSGHRMIDRASDDESENSWTDLWTPWWFILFYLSRGRIRIVTLRCPEVGLELPLWGVQRSD